METYLVGGAVRDKLLNIPCHDHDYVVVGSTASEMIDAGFSPVGKSFPVFLHPKTKEEYALARTERKSGLGYTGFEVDASSDITLAEDLMRRDFTINSMAMVPGTNEIIDPFGGRVDLENGVLRHTSSAFSDDPLRVIRLARFYAKLGFKIDVSTFDRARKMVESGELNTIPPERFWAELQKVFAGANPIKFFECLLSLGVFNSVVFFKTLFGPLTTTNFLKELCSTGDLNVVVAVAGRPANVRVPSNVRELSRNYYKFLECKTPEDIVQFINSCRGWNNSPAWTDVICCLKTLKETSPCNAEVLECISASKLSPEFFPGKTGKELGAAIFNTRVKIAETLLNYYTQSHKEKDDND